MPLPLNQKIQKQMDFLIGARNPRIFAMLATRGFTQKTLDEGWSLLTVAAGAKLRFSERTTTAIASGEARTLIEALDAWENTWLPLAHAVLERHFPEIEKTVFQNLSQTSGAEVILSVGTFLERLEAIQAESEGQKANALLEERGLTEAVKAAALQMIARLQTPDSLTTLPELDPATEAEQGQALVEAWAWYREWSQIARTVVKRGDHLIRLGLRQLSRGSSVGEDEGEDAETVPTPQSDNGVGGQLGVTAGAVTSGPAAVVPDVR